MTSILPAPATNLQPDLPVSPASSTTMAPAQESRPSPSGEINQDAVPHGTRRNRSGAEKDDDNDDNVQAGDGDPNPANSSNSDGPVRKRRGSRKGLDKKFECPWEGCGKKYSRAEHLLVPYAGSKCSDCVTKPGIDIAIN